MSLYRDFNLPRSDPVLFYIASQNETDMTGSNIFSYGEKLVNLSFTPQRKTNMLNTYNPTITAYNFRDCTAFHHNYVI